MNDLILFWDTETTGIPDWHEPSDAPQQPHIVQLAAALVDAESRRIINSMDLVVRPDHWEIPDDVTKIHGITREYALQVGVDEAFVLKALIQLWEKADRRVAHNQSFDARIIRIATKRYADEDLQVRWKAGEAECTSKLARPVMDPAPSKFAKLSDAYEQLVGPFDHDGAHAAWADTRACMDLYFALVDHEPEPETA